ncbi:MAG: hypothetical protein ACLPVO_06605 [Desulfomonilaceae bacterium]
MGYVLMPIEPITICTNQTSFQVYTNPSFSELSRIGSLVRFTADNKTKNVYVWDFNLGHHGDVSIGLKLEDTFDSLDFLKGAAEKQDNETYEMVGSDFLQSFVGKLINKEKIFLSNLLNQNWNWVNDYIKVTGRLRSFRWLLGL